MLTRRVFVLTTGAVLVALKAPGLIGAPSLLGSSAAWAQAPSPEAAVAFINRTGQELVAVVNSGDADAAMRAKLGDVISRVVDVAAVARFCLGSAWQTATPAQRQEFTALFKRVITLSIGGHLGDYKGVTFTTERAIPSDAGVAVRTMLNRPGQPSARVDWVVSNASGSPKIVDVLAEGTSLRLTQRSDYSSFLNSHGRDVQALIAAMRKQVEGTG